MRRGRLHELAVLCLLALLALFAPAAGATGFAPGSTCHIAAPAWADPASLAARPQAWTCADRGWDISQPRAFLRFDLRGTHHADQPLRFETRLTRFAAMRITAIGADGRQASRDLREDEMQRSSSDWLMSAMLPRLDAPVEAVVVRIDAPRHTGLLSSARIKPSPHDWNYADLPAELMLAGLCGILCVPLVFNFAFYRVLRERFLLWHAGAVVNMLVHTIVSSGLINRFVDLPMHDIMALSALSWGMGVIFAALFAVDLIERGMIDPVHRRMMHVMVPWITVWTLFFLFADGPLRAWSAPVYYASFLPVLALFVWVMIVAKARGSRAVNFQIVAWLPLMLTGAVRVLSSLGLSDAPLEMQMEQHVAIGLEVVFTSLGVADRFMAIKRQRDRAREQSRVFEALAERDPLTGLLNRRVVEERFDDLVAQGFTAMAVLDLDRFKQINDGHGHAVGDLVLRAAAEALAPDEDTLAARMGGEEFVILMRGHNIAARAERRRRAITARVASEVPGLDAVVTASMGLVEHPEDSPPRIGFMPLYAHCDRLLYDAKHAGRNRTMSERMQGFARPAAPLSGAAA